MCAMPLVSCCAMEHLSKAGLGLIMFYSGTAAGMSCFSLTLQFGLLSFIHKLAAFITFNMNICKVIDRIFAFVCPINVSTFDFRDFSVHFEIFFNLISVWIVHLCFFFTVQSFVSVRTGNIVACVMCGTFTLTFIFMVKNKLLLLPTFELCVYI